jgi:hypothetical protein
MKFLIKRVIEYFCICQCDLFANNEQLVMSGLLYNYKEILPENFL